MKTHNEFIEEVEEASRPPTLRERTHDALDKEGYKQGDKCKSCKKFIGNSVFCKSCNDFNNKHDALDKGENK